MSDPSPRAAGAARPLLCRLTFHRPATRWAVADDADPCREVLRCRRCGHELRSADMHRWGDEQRRTDDGDPCARLVTCLRCNAEKRVSDHRVRTYTGAEMPHSPAPNRPVERHRCARIQMCTVCGWVEREGWDHDFPGGWRPCIRCDLARHLDPDYGD